MIALLSKCAYGIDTSEVENFLFPQSNHMLKQE